MGIGVAAVAWVVSASLIMCWGRERMDLFVWPYAQWLQALWWFPRMLKMPHGIIECIDHPLLWFVLSVVPPSLGLFIIWRWVSSWGRQPDPIEELYGGSEWGGDADLSSSKMRARRF